MKASRSGQGIVYTLQKGKIPASQKLSFIQTIKNMDTLMQVTQYSLRVSGQHIPLNHSKFIHG